MKSVLGIDTSAYTTSLALVDEAGHLLADLRQILEVGEGKRGLRQSEALFQHVKNLPALFARLEENLVNSAPGAVAVSSCPRNVAGSYMPVFLAGESVARSVASTLGVPLLTFSHQEGHIMAGQFQMEENLPGRYLAVHFSGGTSEVLLVQSGPAYFYDIEVLAATTDLHAGQLVDRVGVEMGLPFPAGRHLEELALAFYNGPTTITIPAAVAGERFSFSGAETQAIRYLKMGVAREEVAFAVLRCIANTLEKVILAQTRRQGIRDVLLVGGVMANSMVRERLRERLEHNVVGLRLHFALPRFSTDNAVGTALLGLIKWLRHTD